MTDPEIVASLALALGLGLLVGLQRQWATDPIAGIRTFPLISLFGALAALVSERVGPWVISAGLLVVAAFVITANISERDDEHPAPGITTEVAAVALYLIGAAVLFGYRVQGVIVAGTITVLLHWKTELHRWVSGLDEREIRAIVRLVLVALVILPVLPNRAYGPFAVLNPFRIWTMVVLIVGISLAAYVAYQVFGSKAGTVMAGFLGGLISSTATTVAYATENKQGRVTPQAGTLVIMIASAVVFVRVLLEIAVVHAAFLPTAAPPLIALVAVMAVLTAFTMRRGRQEPLAAQDASPPSGLRTAIVFGLLYGAILFAVAFAEARLGSRWLYGIAGLSGIVDMDAITLSVTELVRDGRLDASRAWRLIFVGGLSNIVFKGGAVASLATPAMARRVGVLFLVTLAAGAAILAGWSS
ncbi:MAG: MgtC/SapB family protein [Gemmatimonadota bacterium]